MAWDVVTSVWPVLAIGCALAALGFLRALGLECRQGIEEHESERQAALMKIEYELNRQAKLKEDESREREGR